MHTFAIAPSPSRTAVNAAQETRTFVQKFISDRPAYLHATRLSGYHRESPNATCGALIYGVMNMRLHLALAGVVTPRQAGPLSKEMMANPLQMPHHGRLARLLDQSDPAVCGPSEIKLLIGAASSNAVYMAFLAGVLHVRSRLANFSNDLLQAADIDQASEKCLTLLR